MPPDNVIFSSRYNFFKIYINGSGGMTVPAAGIGTPATVLLATHSLGYVHRARVWYEPISGELWPLSKEQYGNGDGGPGTAITTIGDFYLTTSALYARITSSP